MRTLTKDEVEVIISPREVEVIKILLKNHIPAIKKLEQTHGLIIAGINPYKELAVFTKRLYSQFVTISKTHPYAPKESK